MAEEMVSVGCRLPNGLRLEVGFSVSEKGDGGAPFAMVRKLDNYRQWLLRGTNQHLIVRDQTRKPVAMLPNQANREPYVNQVPKSLWDEWVRKNSKSWHLLSGNIFVIPKTSPSEVKATVLDAAAKSKPIFEPMDPSKKMVIEDVTIAKLEEEE